MDSTWKGHDMSQEAGSWDSASRQVVLEGKDTPTDHSLPDRPRPPDRTHPDHALLNELHSLQVSHAHRPSLPVGHTSTDHAHCWQGIFPQTTPIRWTTPPDGLLPQRCFLPPILPLTPVLPGPALQEGSHLDEAGGVNVCILPAEAALTQPKGLRCVGVGGHRNPSKGGICG